METSKTNRGFTTGKLWKKLKMAGRTAGYTAVESALTLFYTSTAKETPAWCKSVIYGALAYFISLIDGIPDLTPILGYTDDIAVMAAALGTLSQYVTPEIKSKAKRQTEALLGERSANTETNNIPSTPDN
ncbi:YkvA family protein [Hahella ganghwensis]|uniref:YkvA family protein n=1 Tax=Hahella ganghwensis TaxID=286420 RepID=UPI000361945E|nr:YkvA family protein [Hahella ganghwensis]